MVYHDSRPFPLPSMGEEGEEGKMRDEGEERKGG
jgi:hypothetical protein